MTHRPLVTKATRRKLVRTLRAWGMHNIARKILNAKTSMQRIAEARMMIEDRLARATQ